MFRFIALRTAVLIAVGAPAGAALANDEPAALVVADGGGLDLPAIKAIRTVTAGELRKRGVALSEDPRQDGVQPVDGRLAAGLSSIGVTRLFVLRIGGRLGQKVPLTLEEVSAQQLTPVASASLTAGSLDEADIVAARLVEAVLGHRSADDTAGMRTVTRQEAEPFRKKPGERFFLFGLPVLLTHGSGNRDTPFGFSLSYFYEAELFRLGVTGVAATRDDSGVAWLGMDVAWLPIDGEISPYIGGGVGYMGAAGTGGLGGKASVGVEFFRLHGVRLVAGVDAIIPFFTGPDQPTTSSALRSIYPMAHLQLGF
jgi:hypothetical protein